MAQNRQKSETISTWLDQQGAGDVPLEHIVQALGIKQQEIQTLLQAPLTAKALLNLNRLALYHHLDMAYRAWPNCTWLERGNEEQSPVIKLIQDTFGLSLLKYVKQAYGEKIVLQYWSDLAVPPQYADLILDEDTDDPLGDIPDDRIVFNPYLDEDDYDQYFVFSSPETTACFRWLINSRYNYSHYEANWTSYLNDPMGIKLAFDLRRVIKKEYWAPLPPDTLQAYLAIAQGLFDAIVPKEYREGRLSPLAVVHIVDLPDDRLTIVQADHERLWGDFDKDVLVFEKTPVRAFVLECEMQSPAALILTTHEDVGNPEKHRQGEHRYLEDSANMMAVTLMPSDRADLEVASQALHETLDFIDYGFHALTHTLCVIRANRNLGEWPNGLISIYRIPGGYMLQFKQEYTFSPQEMAVD